MKRSLVAARSAAVALTLAAGCGTAPSAAPPPTINRVVWLPGGRSVVGTSFTDRTRVTLIVEDGVRSAVMDLLADGAWEVEWSTAQGTSWLEVVPEGDSYRIAPTDGSLAELRVADDVLAVPTSGLLLRADGGFEVVELAAGEDELQAKKSASPRRPGGE